MNSHPSIPVRVYFLVFAGLLILTMVTVAVAFVDLGPLNTPLALVIATLKGLMVALYFMQLRYSPRLTVIFAASGTFWLVILLSLTLSDYISRSW